MASIPRDSVIDPAPVRIRDALRDVGAAEAIARCGWMSTWLMGGSRSQAVDRRVAARPASASVPRPGRVDLGLLTFARATVTLRDGKLITKAQALCVLTELGAPAEVVDDIRQRRYGDPGPASQRWIARRAELTLAFPRPAIEQVVARWSPSTGRSCCEYEQVPVGQLDRSRAAVAANSPQPVRVRLG
jgi:hypothetical protein